MPAIPTSSSGLGAFTLAGKALKAARDRNEIAHLMRLLERDVRHADLSPAIHDQVVDRLRLLLVQPSIVGALARWLDRGDPLVREPLLSEMAARLTFDGMDSNALATLVVDSIEHNLSSAKRSDRDAARTEGELTRGLVREVALELKRDIVNTASAPAPWDAAGRLVSLVGRASQAQRACGEFERLIDDPSTTESALLAFFERHPDFLLGNEYDALYPQVVFPFSTKASSFRPDFILRPAAGASYGPALVELKRASQPLVTQVRGCLMLRAAVLQAVAQLHSYARLCQEPEHRAWLKSGLGVDVDTPTLVLVVGRSSDLPGRQLAATAREQTRSIELLTYDDVLWRFRRRLSLSQAQEGGRSGSQESEPIGAESGSGRRTHSVRNPIRHDPYRRILEPISVKISHL